MRKLSKFKKKMVRWEVENKTWKSENILWIRDIQSKGAPGKKK